MNRETEARARTALKRPAYELEKGDVQAQPDYGLKLCALGL